MSGSGKTEEEEYEYSNEDVENIQPTEGDRLVGAAASSTSRFPFLVGLNLKRTDNVFLCTGILLTPRFILSAAHCNGLLKQRNGRREEERERCVQTTNNGQWYSPETEDISIKCRWLECRKCRAPDLEMITNPPGRAWIGVDKIKELQQKNLANMHEIKRHIRHGESYQGGGSYGYYGGYDITLLEVEKPMIGYRPACLPGPRFDDIRLKEKNSILAGYGNYKRDYQETCETNQFGPMKKHYCDKDHGVGNNACITDKPAPSHEECQEFFKNPQIIFRAET